LKKLMSQFKDFVLRGNVMDLAVGVLIGGAFQDIVASLTENIISPIVGIFAGQNFDHLSLTFLGVTLTYGAFITSVINFIIMAFIIFMIVKAMNTLAGIGKKKQEIPEAEPTIKPCPYCKSEIPLDATRCPHCTSQL
jgi:large conductance mechanosensitive channel protein